MFKYVIGQSKLHGQACQSALPYKGNLKKKRLLLEMLLKCELVSGERGGDHKIPG